MSRLVKNHSTFIQGFEKLLKKLSETSSKITLLTPGRIYTTSSNHQGIIELRITTQMERNNSFKLLARNQSLVQELFLVSVQEISSKALLKEHLRNKIGKHCVIKITGGNGDKGTTPNLIQ